ncbi:hypothetical protein MRX96_026015 [Rhipicephalus microplus]
MADVMRLENKLAQYRIPEPHRRRPVVVVAHTYHSKYDKHGNPAAPAVPVHDTPEPHRPVKHSRTLGGKRVRVTTEAVHQRGGQHTFERGGDSEDAKSSEEHWGSTLHDRIQWGDCFRSQAAAAHHKGAHAQKQCGKRASVATAAVVGATPCRKIPVSKKRRLPGRFRSQKGETTARSAHSDTETSGRGGLADASGRSGRSRGGKKESRSGRT